MKRILPLLLVISLLFLCTACSAAPVENIPVYTPAPSSTSAATPAATPTATPSPVATPTPSLLDSFVEAYNAQAPSPIENLAVIDIHDNTAAHYKTEFRLTAFENAVAKLGTVNGHDILLVNCGIGELDELRLYADGIALEQAVALLQCASPAMDKEISPEEVQTASDHLKEFGSANGYYFGKLGLVYNGIKGEFLLKTE